jgi:hypothetical protein
MRAGAKVGDLNLSAIAYCDDMILLSPNVSGLQQLLNVCQEYASKWKLEFNAKKSIFMNFGRNTGLNVNVKINGDCIPRENGCIYLGLPLGDSAYKSKFIEDRMRKVERCFYSLHGLGCKSHALNPMMIAFIYKQYCQSIIKYGLELIEISKNLLNMCDRRQNIMVKQSIGLSKFVKTTPLFTAIKIESIEQLYFKHKLFFYKQICKNNISFSLFEYLDRYYSIENNSNNKNTFFKQLNDVKEFSGIIDVKENLNETIKVIEIKSKCLNAGLIDSLLFIMNNLKFTRDYVEMISLLTGLLDYKCYNESSNLANIFVINNAI